MGADFCALTLLPCCCCFAVAAGSVALLETDLGLLMLQFTVLGCPVVSYPRCIILSYRIVVYYIVVSTLVGHACFMTLVLVIVSVVVV